MPNTSLANIGLIRFAEQGSTPSTPASTFSGVYMMSDGLYVIDDAGGVTGPLIDTAAASPLTTKGDLFTYSTVDARLPVGTNGYVLRPDSTQSTGLEWVTAAEAIAAQLPHAELTFNESADSTTTSTSFTDILIDGAASAEVTITTSVASSRVIVGFFGYSTQTTSGNSFYDIAVDGTPFAGNDGLTRSPSFGQTTNGNIAFTVLIEGLTAASHTFTLQWKVASGTASLSAGAGTSTRDVHPQLWVREI